MILEVLSVIVMVIAVIFMFWFMLRAASRRIQLQFLRLSQRFAVELTQPPAQLAGFNRPEPFVHGDYRGRELSISVPGKGLQNTRQIETTLKIAVNAKLLHFQITGSGLMGRMRQRDTGKSGRWYAESVDFDQALDVRTNNDARLTRVLGPEQQAKVFGFIKASQGTIVCRHGVLIFHKIGLITQDAERERFEAIAEFLCDWAEEIEASG
jgi:hypothetical protein